VRILLVDDDTRFLDALEALLETLPDVEVLGRAGDGLEAIDMAADLQPDVVLIDLQMPRMSGVLATKRIHAQTPHAQIVMLSGSDVISHERESAEAGAVAYIRKTSTATELPQLLEELRREQRSA
jgi:DNA-binding NarL/FixJ family response regulator